MESSRAAAADEAAARAARCRCRVDELVAGRPVGQDDVRRARAALQRAAERAADAQRRLVWARLRWGSGTSHAPLSGVGAVLVTSPPDPAGLQERARAVPADELFREYLCLGGGCSDLEVEAFVHTGFELPARELTVLSQAVWELTEL